MLEMKQKFPYPFQIQKKIPDRKEIVLYVTGQHQEGVAMDLGCLLKRHTSS